MSEAVNLEIRDLTGDVDKQIVNKTVKEYAILAVAFMSITIFVPDDETTFGIISALPSVFLLSFIFYTKRILEGLTLASLLAFLMAYKGDFFSPMSETLIEVLTDGDTQWLFIVCGLMGSIIALIERGGGAATGCDNYRHALYPDALRFPRSADYSCWIPGYRISGDLVGDKY